MDEIFRNQRHLQRALDAKFLGEAETSAYPGGAFAPTIFPCMGVGQRGSAFAASRCGLTLPPMALDERRWQKKLARKRKTQASRSPLPRLSSTLSPAQAARLPIHDAMVSRELYTAGIGMVGLARVLPEGDLAAAFFLVDVYCLGVKNAFFRVVSQAEWVQLAQQANLEKVHPSCLRKLVEGAVAYARDLGLPPHADYARTAQFFGTIEATACPVRYTYGKDGKPFYVNGPKETPAQSRRIVNLLKRRLGADGFHSMIAVNLPEVAEAAALVADEDSQPRLLDSYEITAEPLLTPAFQKLPGAVQDQIDALHAEIQKARPRQAVPALKALIEQYPQVPSLYNFLYIAHFKLGQSADARRVLQETLDRFPDYLFARIALAEECLDRGETEKVTEIFGGKFNLKELYPDRQRFHITEVLGFQCLVARYFNARGDREQAQRAYDLMCQLNPEHALTQYVGRLLKPSRVGNWLREKLLRR